MELLENMNEEVYNWLISVLNKHSDKNLALRVIQNDKIVNTVKIELDDNGKIKIGEEITW